MNKTINSLLFVFYLLSACFAQKPNYLNKTNIPESFPKLLEEVKKIGDEITIPYKKYQLANGLIILIHEDHSDPICYVDVTYHVGSAREQPGRSGFAHFFEHMMFQGSKHLADDQHIKLITEAGGAANGTTNTDRTNYFETVPSNQLEKMLWLESDRMGFLLDSVTQKKFEIQRATVKNERGQRYDNKPYGLISEKVNEALYPEGHPYSWSTIGYLEDLNRVDVNDLKRFYMRWYGPNNAVLTISGDINTNETLTLIQKYFGNIQRGPEVNKQTATPVTLSQNRYISYEDQIKFPAINFAFPTVPKGHKDEAALNALAEILSQGQGAPLYKGFIETKKMVSTNAYNFSRELAGVFIFSFKSNENSTLLNIESELKNVLDDWEKKGVTDDDLIKYKADFKSNLYNDLSTVQGKGSLIAENYTFTKNANFLKQEVKNNLSITKADIIRVYLTYIKNKYSVILSCVPKGKPELKAHEDNWKMYNRKIELENEEYKNLIFKEPKDSFDRSVMPKEQAAKPITVPDFYTTKINNIPLIGISNNEIPKVNILINFNAGHLYETKEKSGTAELVSLMLKQSSLKTNVEEIQNQLKRLGAYIDISVDEENFTFLIETDKQTLKPTLQIFEEIMLTPKFDAQEFEIQKKQLLDRVNYSQTNPTSIADKIFKKMVYGNNHILSIPVNGIKETIEKITLEDVTNYYNNLNSSMVSIAVSGNISQKQITSELSFLSKIKAGQVMENKNQLSSPIEKTKIYFVDKKNAAQSEIRIGYIALPFEAMGDFYKASIMNFNFSGSFNSRVNYLLREIKGWTYGIKGGFHGTKNPGIFSISGGFKSNTTDSVLIELFKEFKNYTTNGINDDELNFTKNAMTQADGLKYESSLQKLFFAKRVLDYNLPKDYISKQMQILNTITKSEITDLAKKYLPYNNMVIVIVGDKTSNFEKIKKLGLDVIELDTNGNTIN